MREIKADLLPVILEEWSQEKEGEEIHYVSPLPKRCHKWIKYQKELFQMQFESKIGVFQRSLLDKVSPKIPAETIINSIKVNPNLFM